MHAWARPGALARPAGRARLPLAPGAARPSRLRVARPVARGVAADAAQPGSGGGGGGGGGSAQKPVVTGGGDGDGDGGARAPGPPSWARGFWGFSSAFFAGMVIIVAGVFTALKAGDDMSRSLVRTTDLAALRADTAALGAKQEAAMAALGAKLEKLADSMGQARLEAQAAQLGLEGRFGGLEGRFDRLEGRLDRLEGRLTALAVVLGAGLAVGLGRKPGAGRGAG
ncbi:hypothetical protein Rsub_12381 [Raphidocelis subcapitata]|uniref:Uncharacterized protein n=1 Tax=Raphidocelis subcapitata TaxID=307507 RepID=A0A2V0PQB1_9CHLO|nr:hypothetical protein Rsub_12381 [Raphidocelis subcapitata]|eukprot:GBF99687.1 hypothetical protein Rsub_12381 [Raphidocelis subcapitata]